MRIAILGAGNVGGALGRAWAAKGHSIHYGVRDAGAPKYQQLAAASGPARIGEVRDAVESSDVITLAVPWDAVKDALAACGDLTGRILIDATNPLQVGANGLSLALGFNRSGGEEVAQIAKGARVVKTLNSVGFGVMDRARGYPVPPVMFLAGDDAEAKATASALVSDLGFQAIDAGSLLIARLLEPYAMLWINQVANRGADPRSAFAFMDPGQMARG